MDDETMLKIVEAMSGETGRRIVETLIISGKTLSDEEISNMLGLKINDVRRTLYELASHGFVAYRRSSGEGSWWYTYSWFTNKDMVEHAINKRMREIARVLGEWLSYSEHHPSYICPYDFTLYVFDDAFENNFRCLKCGADLVEIDSQRVLEFVKSLIQKLGSNN